MSTTRARTKANRRREGIKAQLRASGHTYDDVARLADVTWRMVKFWVDGQRTSAKVERAFNTLVSTGRIEAQARQEIPA